VNVALREHHARMPAVMSFANARQKGIAGIFFVHWRPWVFATGPTIQYYGLGNPLICRRIDDVAA